MDYARCSSCGKQVSNLVSEELIIRAYLECPECIEKKPDETALQKRVEELEKLSDAHKKLACLVDKQHQETLASIRKAVEEIEDSMQSADWEVASVYDGALLILKNHGLMEDK